jgi:hypothetical protein
MGEKRNAHIILVGKLREKRELRRCRNRRKVNVKTSLNEIRWEGVFSSKALCEHGTEHSGSIKCSDPCSQSVCYVGSRWTDDINVDLKEI